MFLNCKAPVSHPNKYFCIECPDPGPTYRADFVCFSSLGSFSIVLAYLEFKMLLKQRERLQSLETFLLKD